MFSNFIYLLAIFISFLGNVYSDSLLILIIYYYLLLLGCMCSLYPLDINLLSDMMFADVLSQLQNTDSAQFLSKLQWHFFTEIEKTNVRFIMEPIKTLNRQSNLKKKNKVEGTILPDFKLCYKSKVTKSVWC